MPRTVLAPNVEHGVLRTVVAPNVAVPRYLGLEPVAGDGTVGGPEKH